MPVRIEVRGAEDLQKVAKRFKAAGEQGKQFRRELVKDINRETKPLKADAKMSARSILPKRNGLAALVAKSRFSTRTRFTGKTAGVKITAKKNGTAQNLNRIDRGTVRHPLFRNRKLWFSQPVAKGWFTDPMRKGADKVRKSIARLVDQTAKKLDK